MCKIHANMTHKYHDQKTGQELIFINEGLTDFDEIHLKQIELFNELLDNYKSSTSNYLILCEHYPVYTMGKSGNIENLLLPELHSELRRIERGGDITFHGPGQLVGYPILNLAKFKLGLKTYVELIENSIISVLDHFGIVGTRSDKEIGVWVDLENENARKICALGIKSSRFITMHGFALNVNTDLRFYDKINPCGITDKSVTSMNQELGYEVDLSDVKLQFLLEFIRKLGFEK